MIIPYNRVHVLGEIVVATRSGHINTFSLDGGYISTWKHPDTIKSAEDVTTSSKHAEVSDPTTETAVTEPASSDALEPPAKRLRLDESDVSSSKATDAVDQDQATAPDNGGETSQRKRGKGGKKNAQTQVRKSERPTFADMASTPDGKHLVAICGHEKSIWVFQHDGQGKLGDISRRIMPKRPVSVFIGPDSQIISADKFGDVYAIPLIPSAEDSQQQSSGVTRAPPTKASFAPTANTFTVHSKRNLESLKSQQRQAELNRKRMEEQGGDAQGDNTPAFEHTLLLGHVSMLTDLVLGQATDGSGRNYIISCDRDEHIRVSRYAPQAYVIENFCLGHKEFVGALAIPTARREVLVSGGGDPDVFVWNWEDGQLLSTTSILSLVQEIVPEAKKVAVTKLFTLTYPSESGDLTYVLAIVENVKAIFSWKLRDDNVLKDPGITQLPGNPLHLAVIPKADQPPSIIVAIDTGEAVDVPSLNIYSLTTNDERLAVDTTSTVTKEPPFSDDLEATPDEIRGLFYGIENLRKSTEAAAVARAGDEGTPDTEGPADDITEEP